MKLNVLVVDDNAINLKLLEVILKKTDLANEIIVATNGFEALDLIDKRNEDIHVILLDIVMPVMNGLEFLDNLRARYPNFSVPVIALTTDETKKSEVFDRGAFAFMTKPVNDKALKDKLTEIANLLEN